MYMDVLRSLALPKISGASDVMSNDALWVFSPNIRKYLESKPPSTRKKSMPLVAAGFFRNFK